VIADTMTAQAATETYETMWHALRGTQGRKRGEGLTVLADFLESIGEVNLSARFRGFASCPSGAYMPYTPWPLEMV
jgi:hypothetical protein